MDHFGVIYNRKGGISVLSFRGLNLRWEILSFLIYPIWRDWTVHSLKKKKTCVGWLECVDQILKMVVQLPFRLFWFPRYWFPMLCNKMEEMSTFILEISRFLYYGVELSEEALKGLHYSECVIFFPRMV